MIPRSVKLCALGLSLSTFACDARGVNIGSEELCIADPRLLLASRASDERLSTCTRIGDNRLVNGDFEAPLVESCKRGRYCTFAAADVVGWNTTSPTQVIELWADGYGSVRAESGLQFLELDAESQDTLWQDVALPPGQLMYWSLLHRGRDDVETMELVLGPADAPRSQGVFSSSTDAWYPYSGLYRVGDQEATTRFALVSRSGVDRGNLVDAMFFAPVD